MAYDDEIFDREDNIDNHLENENEDSLNAAYDRVSGSGAMPSLEDFLGGDYSDPVDGSAGIDDGIGSVIGDPELSDPFGDVEPEGPDEPSDAETPESARFNPKSIIDGSYFISENFSKKLPFIFFLILMAMVYITNRNITEYQIKRNITLKREVRDLRAESITIAGELMNISKETEVSIKVEEYHLGIHEQNQPPMYFIIDKFERADSLMENLDDTPKRDYINDFNDFEDDYKKVN